MARLAEHPGPELMRKFLQKSEELLDSPDHEGEEEKGQGVANTLWALAVLDELRPEFVEQVSRATTSSMPSVSCEDLVPVVLFLSHKAQSDICHFHLRACAGCVMRNTSPDQALRAVAWLAA